MKTNSASTELVMIAPWLIAILYVFSIWSQLPTEMTTHYDIAGNPNGWTGKNEMALISLGLGVGMYLLFRFLPRIDPRSKLQTANFQRLRFVIMLFLAVILTGIFYLGAHQGDSQSLLGPQLALVSLMIAGIGNYMTTVKPNWFVGIRTPWTLDSETVWRKTHQLGGRLMVAGGLLGAALAMLVPAPYTTSIVVGIILAVSLIPVVYSYVYYRQEKARQLN